MSDERPALPPAGWYPDPAGGPDRRWWDGTRWTERVETHSMPIIRPEDGGMPAAPAAPAAPASTVPGVAGAPRLSPRVSPHTWAFWIVALTPILGIVGVSVIDFSGYIRRLFALAVVSRAGGSTQSIDAFGLLGPTFAIAQVLGLLTIAAFIVFTYLDERILKSRGIDRPFPWGWSFFTLLSGGQFVTVIGRTVVAHRRTQRSASAPLWVFIGLSVVEFVVLIVKIGLLLATIAQVTQSLQGQVGGLGG